MDEALSHLSDEVHCSLATVAHAHYFLSMLMNTKTQKQGTSQVDN